MRIYLVIIAAVFIAYFIGVAVGKAVERNKVEIEHVSYTPQQMEYDK